MSYLNHLRTFVAVYRSGSVTQAAAQLAMSQPAASMQIKALENAMGKPLFEKVGRRLLPTEAAHSLVRSVEPHIDGLESAFASARAAGSGLVGTVHIGGPAEFLEHEVLPALAPLSESGLHFIITNGLAGELITRLQDGKLDVVIATKKVAASGIEFSPMYHEDFVLVAAPQWAVLWPKAEGADRGRYHQAILEMPWLAYADDLPIVRRVLRSWGIESSGLKAKFVVPDLRGLLACTIHGAGITCLPRYICHEALRRGVLVALGDMSAVPRNTIHLAYSKFRLQQPRNLYVVRFLKDRFTAVA